MNSVMNLTRWGKRGGVEDGDREVTGGKRAEIEMEERGKWFMHRERENRSITAEEA